MARPDRRPKKKGWPKPPLVGLGSRWSSLAWWQCSVWMSHLLVEELLRGPLQWQTSLSIRSKLLFIVPFHSTASPTLSTSSFTISLHSNLKKKKKIIIIKVNLIPSNYYPNDNLLFKLLIMTIYLQNYQNNDNVPQASKMTKLPI